jgi:hypothetical protein
MERSKERRIGKGKGRGDEDRLGPIGKECVGTAHDDVGEGSFVHRSEQTFDVARGTRDYGAGKKLREGWLRGEPVGGVRQA